MLSHEAVMLLLQAARIGHAARSTCELEAAEWAALRFLAQANARSRTASRLAEFQASTRAAVSQVIGRLQEGGYVTREPAADDGRRYDLKVTAKGRAALMNDPVGALAGAVASLPEQDQIALRDSLRKLLAALGDSGVRRHFDFCRDCAHLVADSETAPSQLACGLLKLPVDIDATKLLCASFRTVAE
jgi:DNA-binding MarR family transcriptional regulator